MDRNAIPDETRSERERIDREIMELVKKERGRSTLNAQQRAGKLLWMRQDLRQKLIQTPPAPKGSKNGSNAPSWCALRATHCSCQCCLTIEEGGL